MVAQQRTRIKKMDKPRIQLAQYHAGPKAVELEKQEINRMLLIDVIEASQMGWASLIVFLLKKVRHLCFCVDYRKLNAVTIQDWYLTPCMD